MRKMAGNLPVGSIAKPKSKKGNSTQKAKKTRSTPRYYELKVRISAEDYTRGKPFFQEHKYLLKFLMDAYNEKINRAEAINKAARLKILAGNVELLLPIIQEMHREGKLNFLFQKGES